MKSQVYAYRDRRQGKEILEGFGLQGLMLQQG